MDDAKDLAAAVKDAESAVDALLDEAADELASMKVSGSNKDDAPFADVEDQTATTEPSDDPDLWKPHPLPEDCPVCMVPLPREADKSVYWPCCGKMICTACDAENDRVRAITNRKREEKELPPLKSSCAFCRTPAHEDDAGWQRSIMQRVDKGDARAMLILSKAYRTGDNNLAKNEAKATALLEKAADVGSAEAKGVLGATIIMGELGLGEDKERGGDLIIDAAKMGDVLARYFLGVVFANGQEHAVAIKHWKLAAAAGHEESMKKLFEQFALGHLNKADLEESVRAHQEACEEMKSEERRRVIAAQEAKAGNDDALKHIYGAYYVGYISKAHLEEALSMHQAGSEEEEIDCFLSRVSKN